MENGIDIPNVNTIIVQNTQLFGLAQLHQLRGRVGRAAVQAYAYLLHPRIETISAEAKQRLMVLQRETDLGSGASLAQSDLQMRGAGNLFGEAQKGAGGLADIGLDLYVEVLQKAMRFLERKRALGLPDDEEVDAELLQASVDEVLLMGLDDSLATN
jgi:transcription-repair coupling factor (superfamily II helicase)